MYIYIYIYIYTYVNTYIYPHIYLYLYACMYVLTRTGTHKHTHTHTNRVSRPAGRFANVFTCSMPICVYKGILYGLRKKLAKSALIIDR